MVDIASVDVKVNVDLSTLNARTDQAKKATENLDKNLNKVASSAGDLGQTAKATSQNIQTLNKAHSDLDGTAQNLQSRLRLLTTELFGTNIAAVAVGTALGQLAVKAVSELGQALITSVTQFASVQNAMSRVDVLAQNVGKEFAFIQEQADKQNVSLADASQQWAKLATAAREGGVSLDQARQFLIQYSAAQQVLQNPTLATSFNKTTTAFGQFVGALDNATGISQIFIDLLKSMTKSLDAMSGWLSKPVTPLEKLKNELRGVSAELEAIKQNSSVVVGPFTTRPRTDAENLDHKIEMLQREADLEEKILVASKGDAETLLRRQVLSNNINLQLEHEVDIARQRRDEQEVSNKLFEVENQFKQTGLALSQEESKAMRERLALAQAASQIQPIRESLRPSGQAEDEQFADRMKALQTFYQGRNDLSAEFNALNEAEWSRHQTSLAQIQAQAQSNLINASFRTADQLVATLQILGQKSKAWAKASMVISTALQVARAVQATHAAYLQVWADPTVPLAAKPVVSAGVLALGAAQIGLIIAAGAMSGSSSVGGGGAVSAGGSSGGAISTDTTSEPPKDFGRAVTINLHGEYYSKEQVSLLIDRINDEVKDGAQLISTESRRGALS